MPHLAPPAAVMEIRAAATANELALLSVAAQVDHQLEHVETFPNTPAKGQLRDGLGRLKARYLAAADMNGKMIDLATVILAMLGAPTLPAEDPPVASTLWSTGAW